VTEGHCDREEHLKFTPELDGITSKVTSCRFNDQSLIPGRDSTNRDNLAYLAFYEISTRNQNTAYVLHFDISSSGSMHMIKQQKPVLWDPANGSDKKFTMLELQQQ
jgi:hypothetical protein